MNDEHVGRRGKERDRREIRGRLVRKIGMERRRADEGERSAKEQRVAVGSGFRDDVRADLARAPWPVLHDDLAPERASELFRQQACDEIGTATRRIRNDEADRLHRIGLS